MTHPDPAHSGSRWEPAATPPAGQGEPPTPPPTATPPDAPASASTAEVPQPPATPGLPAPAARRRAGRRGLLVAVAATGLVLAGGLGGFAVGAATAGDGGADSAVTESAVPGQDDSSGRARGFPPGGGFGVPPGSGGDQDGTTSDDGTGTTTDGDPA
ncbi:hypothetical protein ACI782_22750 [Geodermatophilus sp. SYSU D00703]